MLVVLPVPGGPCIYPSSQIQRKDHSGACSLSVSQKQGQALQYAEAPCTATVIAVSKPCNPLCWTYEHAQLLSVATFCCKPWPAAGNAMQCIVDMGEHLLCGDFENFRRHQMWQTARATVLYCRMLTVTFLRGYPMQIHLSVFMWV